MSHKNNINKFIQSFTTLPKELYRINNGRAVILRAHPFPSKPQGVFDLLTLEGKVRPLALTPKKYEFPNGASMRPNSPRQQDLVRELKGASACVYRVPKGTELPDNLILVHEFRDHYSLQARESMTVDELNSRITEFLITKGDCLTREEWMKRYPRATERALWAKEKGKRSK